jgi:hypothetical protein
MFSITCSLVNVYVGMEAETRPNTGIGEEEIIAKVHCQIFQV